MVFELSRCLAKKPPKNVLKKSKAVAVEASHYLAFSVGKGLRVKYASLKTKDGKPVMIENNITCSWLQICMYMASTFNQ